MTPAHAGNIAQCEAALIEKLDDGGQFITYAPAVEFISSVYNDEKALVKKVEGQHIRAILCKRRDVVPTLRDFPILATGIPLSLSPNFDANNSRATSLYFKDGKFSYQYVGTALSDANQKRLDDIMEIFNFQPHDLTEAEAEVKVEAKNEIEPKLRAERVK